MPRPSMTWGIKALIGKTRVGESLRWHKLNADIVFRVLGIKVITHWTRQLSLNIFFILPIASS